VFFLKSSGENPQEEPADLSGCLHYRLLLAKKEPADLSRQFLNLVTGCENPLVLSRRDIIKKPGIFRAFY